jgi:hypothetical protein
MLVNRFDRLSPKPDDLVFMSPKGLPMHDHRFVGLLPTSINHPPHLAQKEENIADRTEQIARGI